ncbi:hypothetical protein CNMCM5793_007175 [Aspergillus hiratsukae]|uniref:Prion-inhibition and propagation HeLo domain-containing protein n=1 Tax=Aspergillus hiratsukae TaxID=1194566 RepID=A0A8H6PHH8_9EURO|nr:hypothetical protein CNMCM5793_007175 [Aspergillus hiratsukae]
MAEPFGIVAGAVGIAAAFTACIDCFEYIHFGRHFRRDFQTDLLTLNCARLRLSRWGQSVHVLDDPHLGRQDATAEEIQTVKNSLYQILVLFANSEEISLKYRHDAKPGQDLAILNPQDEDVAFQKVYNKIKDLVNQRKKAASILKRAGWALYHRSEFRSLIQDITNLIDGIEKLFPAQEAQLAAVQEEIAQIDDEQSLKAVEFAAHEIDPLFEMTAHSALTGHRYSNIVVKGRAQAGDTFGSDWHGHAGGSSHVYDDIQIEIGGKAQMGNKFGGKDFWED